MEHQEEGQLVERAAEGDRAAFAALYDLHVARVYRHIYYRVPSQADAEDITQDVFVRAWNAIGSYRGKGGPFVAWLLAIARNLVADYYRTKKKTVSLEVESPSDLADSAAGPEALVEASLNRNLVRSAVARLKGDRQRVILMRFIDGFSYEEIARALGKSAGAVRVIQYRALQELRHQMKQGA